MSARCEVMGLKDEEIALVNRLVQQTPFNYSQDLMGHQKEFIYYSLNARGILNGSEQGTSKTLPALCLAYIWGFDRVVVSAPKDVIPVWVDEHKKWFDESRPDSFTVWNSVGTTVKQKQKALQILKYEPGRHMFLVNQEVVSKLEEELIDFASDKLFIIDESHNIKSPDSKIYKSCNEVAKHCNRIIESSGTPLGNNVGDLWSQFHIIDPNILKQDYNDFVNRFAIKQKIYGPGGRPLVVGGVHKTKIVGCSDPYTLMSMISSYWFRATKATCLQLPPKYHHKIYLDLTDEERFYYEAVKQDGEFALGKELSLNGDAVIAIRLQQITSGTVKKFNPDIPEDEGEIQELDSCKLRWLREFVDNRLVNNPSVRCIIWCRFNAEVDIITDELQKKLGAKRVFSVTRKTKSTAIEEAKASFNSRNIDGVQILVAQIDKMYSGHNLQAGDINIGYSHTWSYIKRAQFEDRTHRNGRSDGVEYLWLIAKDTIDEALIAATDAKRDLAIRLAPDTVSGVRSAYEETNEQR